MSDELEAKPIESVIMRDKEAKYDRAQRARNIDIMSVPIKESATEAYYIANDRRKKRELMEKGL